MEDKTYGIHEADWTIPIQKRKYGVFGYTTDDNNPFHIRMNRILSFKTYQPEDQSQ